MARPRSQEAHDSALHAATALIVEVGLDAITIEEVAARSGVAKSTLYRHFGDLDSLVLLAARTQMRPVPTPDLGSLEADLLAIFDHFRNDPAAQVVNRLLPCLVDPAHRSGSLRQLLDDMLSERRRPIGIALQLAQLRGEVSAELDVDTACALILGPFVFRHLVERRAVDADFVDAVIANAVSGMRALPTA